MNGLSCGEESMTICSAVLIQYQRVTDGQTDVKPIAITCFSIADARKNGQFDQRMQTVLPWQHLVDVCHYLCLIVISFVFNSLVINI